MGVNKGWLTVDSGMPAASDIAPIQKMQEYGAL